MQILVVEHDKRVRELMTRSLVESGFGVDESGLAIEAEKLALEGVHDALIVDLELQDRDGLELIQRLRAQAVSVPMLILSARRSVDERVKCLEMGGDAYMTKPFAMVELVARVRALLRRSTPVQAEATRLRVGNLELDLIRREARRDGKEIHLTQQEFALLEYLVRNAGRVVTRTTLLDHLCKARIGTSTNTVDVHVHRLRGKLDKNAQRPLIRTIRGAGYILTE